MLKFKYFNKEFIDTWIKAGYDIADLQRKRHLIRLAYIVYYIKSIPNIMFTFFQKYIYAPIWWEFNKNKAFKITTRGIDRIHNKAKNGNKM